MTAKLEKTLKREVLIDGQAYTVAIDPEGIKLTQKGFRKGQELTWRALLGGAQASGGEAPGAPSIMSGARENSMAPSRNESASGSGTEHR